MMPDQRLAQIIQRADLYCTYGDRAALRPEDVADLLADIAELRSLVPHLIALHRQQARATADLRDGITAAAQARQQARTAVVTPITERKNPS